ncbi:MULTISPECIES: hypothetical protein [Colwellia]|uniref:hypothetical protein n=1 Tax=Colwellia TaxID=28228 RepID=UPI0013564116|nr:MULTISPECIES: hypothetical protein [Colwellia]
MDDTSKPSLSFNQVLRGAALMNIPVQHRFFTIPDENTCALSIMSGFYHAGSAILACLVLNCHIGKYWQS